MNIRKLVVASIAVLSLAACQREEAAVAPVSEPAATAAPTVATVEPAAAPVVDPVLAQPRMDFVYRCRISDGAWSDATQACEVTPMLCPTFGTWVDGSGCKSDIAEADCKADGQQFVADQGCLIRSIPASAMRDEDFKKG